MESGERREPIVLYGVPLLPELEVKTLIINALPQADVAPKDLTLKKKENKYQVFLKVPSSKVQEICALKDFTINKEPVCIRRSFTEAQVFISRIPDQVAIDEILKFLEDKFGKIAKYHEGQPHEEVKPKLRHCYIQFQKDEDAEKCLFSYQKLKINDYEFRPSRNYKMSESDETDKKLFLKIASQVDDQEDLQRTINQHFRKEGQLREKIKIENNKASIIYTSPEVADRVLRTFKTGKVGKYEVVLRPHNSKDGTTVFLAGLRANVTQAELQETFKHYSPILSCEIQQAGNNPLIKNGTITFGTSEAYKRLLVDFKEDPLIRHVFIQSPYVAPHMNTKDRIEYNSFMKGNNKKPMMPIVPPVGFPMQGPMQTISYMPMGRPIMGPMRPMGSYQPMG